MTIAYQADHGAKFDSKSEYDYERSRKICNAISAKKLRMLTYDGEVIRERDFLNHIELDNILENVYYFHCNDKEVLEILSSEFFARDFEENVTYFYDEDNDRWRELDDVINNYRTFINDLLKAKTIIMDGITQ